MSKTLTDEDRINVIDYALAWIDASDRLEERERVAREAKEAAEKAREEKIQLERRLIGATVRAGILNHRFIVFGRIIKATTDYCTMDEPALRYDGGPKVPKPRKGLRTDQGQEKSPDEDADPGVICTREANHSGPCNGFPRLPCCHGER